MSLSIYHQAIVIKKDFKSVSIDEVYVDYDFGILVSINLDENINIVSIPVQDFQSYYVIEIYVREINTENVIDVYTMKSGIVYYEDWKKIVPKSVNVQFIPPHII